MSLAHLERSDFDPHRCDQNLLKYNDSCASGWTGARCDQYDGDDLLVFQTIVRDFKESTQYDSLGSASGYACGDDSNWATQSGAILLTGQKACKWAYRDFNPAETDCNDGDCAKTNMVQTSLQLSTLNTLVPALDTGSCALSSGITSGCGGVTSGPHGFSQWYLNLNAQGINVETKTTLRLLKKSGTSDTYEYPSVRH